MQTETGTNVIGDRDTSDGWEHGRQLGTAAKLGFYGTTPIVQPKGAAQALVTDGSGGAAAPTNGVQPVTGTLNSTILNNTVATILAQTNAIQAVLVNLGLMKGSA